MKKLVKSRLELTEAGRWDIDFHLPPQGILAFPSRALRRVDDVADVVRDVRDPSLRPDEGFRYLDISSIEVETGTIVGAQELRGEDAPLRARKVVRAFDILVSTVRPTRGAVAIVPILFHDEIASTGFSIVRPKAGVNPFYLHFALRLASTREQLRKWSTGSSYPAILDEDVAKTLIPVPDAATQDQLAARLMDLSRRRTAALASIREDWDREIRQVTRELAGGEVDAAALEAQIDSPPVHEWGVDPTADAIASVLSGLPPLTVDSGRRRGRRPVNGPQEIQLELG